MTNIAVATMKALAASGHVGLDQYAAALSLAVEEVRPLFGREVYGQTYREVAAHPEWLAVSLMANAVREGDGAGRLWSLAACTQDPKLVAELKRHAIDESMHARAYVAILDLVFPDCANPELREDLLACSPGYHKGTPLRPIAGSPYARNLTLDDLVQMNIAEIRTRIHHLLQRPMVFAHCNSDGHLALDRILVRLLQDETSHVAYTARLIEQQTAVNGPEELVYLMRARMADFEAITQDELGQRIFD